jgi:hypothetical protein
VEPVVSAGVWGDDKQRNEFEVGAVVQHPPAKSNLYSLTDLFDFAQRRAGDFVNIGGIYTVDDHFFDYFVISSFDTLLATTGINDG